MNNGIIKYEELYQVTTFSKKIYFIKAVNIKILDEALETKKFVRFGDSRVNVSSIDTIDLASNEDNFYQNELKCYKLSDQAIIKKEVKLWKGKVHKDLTPAVLKDIIDRYIIKEDKRYG